MQDSIELYTLSELIERSLRLDAIPEVSLVEDQVMLYDYIVSQMLDNIDEL